MAQMRFEQVVGALSLVALSCCGGCVKLPEALTPQTPIRIIEAFFKSDASEEMGAQLIVYNGTPLHLAIGDVAEVCRALRADSRPDKVDEYITGLAHYAQLVINGKKYSLVIWVERRGFYVGGYSRCHFRNKALGRMLRRTVEENSWYPGMGALRGYTGRALEHVLRVCGGELDADMPVPVETEDEEADRQIRIRSERILEDARTPDWYEKRADLLRRKGEYRQAIWYYTIAIAGDSDYWQAHEGRARAYAGEAGKEKGIAKELYRAAWSDIEKCRELGRKLDPQFVESVRRAHRRGAATRPEGQAWTEPVAVLDLGNGVSMKFVSIPAGTFQMGSPASEGNRGGRETQHTVKLTRPFYMGVHEVTQEQYEAVMGSNPSFFKGARNPVEMVSWNDATAFCAKMSQKTGKVIRLPTEAEWEYACRAGAITAYGWGDRLDAKKCNFADVNTSFEWSDKTADDGYAKTAPAGSYPPNAWGLYDMHGNVYEWCQDWDGSYPNGRTTDPTGPVSGSFRVFRGGSWNNHPWFLRSAYRDSFVPRDRDANLGFRVVVSSSSAVN